MYLKNIELQGFKSFANKIDLKFDQGITGIVGPNGSGKSNIADAVRWVLGEQSAKQLRGSKMEDVIFAGTENRKPLGFSQVSITIDNTDGKLPIDYTEVTVTRRVYRSGESEYAINGSNCRLKDIQELFFDTGIGKEGYSIIGQGQIDKILSSRPEDRRNLFDEAAGIVKYKKRKEIAEKKLAEEKQNLTRIYDILTEIEHQLGPLEEQAKVAENYLDLKKSLKTLDIHIFLLEIDRLKKEQAQLEDKTAHVQNEMKETESALAISKEKYESLEEELETLATSIEDLKTAVTNTQLNKEKLENEIKLTKEQITSIKKSNVHMLDRLKVIEEALNDYEVEKQTLEETANESLLQVKEQKEALKTIEEEIEAQSIKISHQSAQVESLKATIIQNLNEISNINSKIQRYSAMKEHITIRKSQLHQKYIKTISDEEEDGLQQKKYHSDYNSLKEFIQKNQEKKEGFEKQLAHIRANKDEKNNALQKFQRSYHQAASKYEALKGITEQYEGYNYSIRKIMAFKEKQGLEKEIIGVVADIIQVDKAYELAIEIALGGSIQHIITENEQVAKETVNYLKTHKYGRATFLPLTSIVSKATHKNHPVIKEEGVIDIASHLVSYEGKFKKLVDSLLGRVIVVDTIDHGIAIAKKYNHSLRLVTLTGELLNPGGAITGGSYKNNHNFLGRKRELEALEKLLGTLNHQMKETKASIIALETEEKSIVQKLEGTLQLIQENKLEINTLKMTLSQYAQKNEEYQEIKKDIQREMAELEEQLVDVSKKIDDLTKDLKTLEKENKEAEETVEKITRTTGDDQKKHQNMQEKITSLRIKLSSLEQEKVYHSERLNRVIKECEKLFKEKKHIKTSIENNLEAIEKKEEDIKALEQTIKKDQEEVIQKETQLKNWYEEKESKNKALKNYFNERESLTERMTLLDKEAFRLTNQKEKYIEQINQLMDYMWTEYELTPHSAKEYQQNIDKPLATMKKEVNELKHKIRQLGEVNVNAIEDYQQLSNRYEFLKTQREDLLQAEANLVDIIEELETSMRKQFDEQFKEINKRFNQVFKELFGGGKGFLELTDGADILEAGIKIVAQPPGKKLQNMMLLSGGERAFTAIALLFAIQSLKPSPFCVLDEIEAALDDANVNRFAKYLHQLTKDTQFIVITHRKGTMESADALYGITMQEKGISTLVSVKLIENEIIE